MDSGKITFSAWLLTNNHKEVEELPYVCISDVGTCIAKFKPLVDKMEKKGGFWI